MSENKQSYDAFISYKHKSGFYMAQVIYDKLTHNGYSVFMDKHLKRGEYEEQIKDAVANSRNFILVLFPKDLNNSNDENDWLRKEAQWASETPNINIIPVFCEDFNTKKIKTDLPESLKKALSYQSVTIHKDYSLDSDLDKLCDRALKNANPIKPLINAVEFFNTNLHDKTHLTVKSIDFAFHAGASWLRAGKKKDILQEILNKGIPTRVLINTPEAAEQITRFMRDELAIYDSFERAKEYWGKYAKKYEGILQVRICPIPLLRVYHNIKFNEAEPGSSFDRMHIKYYAYQNLNLENAFEHELSSFSKYYEIYQKEFEFLWNESTPI